jgi:hypothetical protein
LDGPPMRHNKALALARLSSRSSRGHGTGSHLLPEDLGRLR